MLHLPKGQKWLDDHGIAYTARHIKADNPTADELREWVARSGLPLKRFFNTSGLVYKNLGLKDKLPTMTEDEQITLLASDGMCSSSAPCWWRTTSSCPALSRQSGKTLFCNLWGGFHIRPWSFRCRELAREADVRPCILSIAKIFYNKEKTMAEILKDRSELDTQFQWDLTPMFENDAVGDRAGQPRCGH